MSAVATEPLDAARGDDDVKDRAQFPTIDPGGDEARMLCCKA